MQALLFAGLLQFRPENSASSEYLASIFDKLQAVRETPAPRVILVGGSGVAFGFNSDVMTEVLEKPVINFAIHAALPFEWYLNHLEPFLHEGDTVVFIPEYIRAGLNEHGAMNGESVRMALLRPGFLKQMPPRIWNEINLPATYHGLEVDGVLRLGCLLVQSAAKDWCAAARRTFPQPVASGHDYDRRAFNQRGDHAAHWTRSNQSDFAPTTVDVEGVCSNIEMLNRTGGDWRKKGIHTFFSFAWIADSIYQAHADSFSQIEKRFKHDLQIPILEPSYIVQLTRDKNYDTPYHLTGPAVEQRSRDLAHEIKTRLESETRSN